MEPSATGSQWRRKFIGCLIAGSLVLSACSSDGDSLADGAEQPTDQAVDLEGSDQQSADDDGQAPSAEELTFGDPADVGFEEVQDIEEDPVVQPTSATDDLPSPEEVIPEITEQLEESSDEEEILDTVEILDTNTETPTDRDGRSRNSVGELAVLDEAANLACAHVEVALSHIDDGSDSIAIERIWSAADRAKNSEIETVRNWAGPLAEVIAGGDVADLAPLVGFITVCAEGGYEL